MVNRPDNWNTMTPKEQGEWLRQQRHEAQRSGGPHHKLTEKDAEKVWGLMKTYDNKSVVAKMLGVNRRTIMRFLVTNPIPETFAIEQNVKDYSEMQTWVTRQKGFSEPSVITGYLGHIQKFHNWMKEHHPERTRPKLWTSDDILEFVQTFEPYQQHNVIVPLRQLANKSQKDFPFIDLGLLPTKKTHQAKRSLAGKEEYYLDIGQIVSMIENVPYKDEVTKARNKCVIALPFNIACRMGSAKTGKGLLGILIENMNLDAHSLRMQDKGSIWWNVQGLGDDTIRYLRDYLTLRGNPTSGLLFVKEDNNTPLKATEANKIIKQAGKNANIEGKNLTEKSFRKSLVKHTLEVLEMNPICLVGTGRNPKTCFCVGWSDLSIVMQHYAPKLTKQIEKGRQTFVFRKDIGEVIKKQKTENLRKTLAEKGINIDEGQLGTLLAVIEALA
jgi:integrase